MANPSKPDGIALIMVHSMFQRVMHSPFSSYNERMVSKYECRLVDLCYKYKFLVSYCKKKFIQFMYKM